MKGDSQWYVAHQLRSTPGTILHRAFTEALAAADRLHDRLVSAAEDAGYIRQTLYRTKPLLDGLFVRAQDDPTVYPLVASGIDFLKSIAPQFDRFSETADEFAAPLALAVNSTGTFSATSDSASMMWSIEYFVPAPISAPPNRKSRAQYTAVLKELDKSLAVLYDAVWQADLATTSDPHRAALFMIRTLFDNFFALWLQTMKYVPPNIGARKGATKRSRFGDPSVLRTP